MTEVVRFSRGPRASRFAPPPARRRRGALPLPSLIIGAFIVLAVYGPQIFGTAPADKAGPAPAPLAAVRVVDGDTLHAGDQRIRLLGIDAPEKAQTCRDAQGRSWACGLAATARLQALVAHGQVACAPQGHDRYGRTLAVCSAGDVADVGRVLVRAGYAVSYMSRGDGYLAEEDAARDDGVGLWRGAFERPADWRRRHRNSG
jgi:endonuclease YncB( thermonuclease family)